VDQDGKRFTIQIDGNKTLQEVCEACHAQWGLQPWIRVNIKRQDNQPSYLEDGGSYVVLAEHGTDADPRPEVQLRVDLSDRTFLIDKVRLDNDPSKVMKMLAENYGFVKTKPTRVQFTPATPWASGQTVTIAFKTSTSCEAVKLEPYSRRRFILHMADEP
jgi:hypothetical protein